MIFLGHIFVNYLIRSETTDEEFEETNEEKEPREKFYTTTSQDSIHEYLLTQTRMDQIKPDINDDGELSDEN